MWVEIPGVIILQSQVQDFLHLGVSGGSSGCLWKTRSSRACKFEFNLLLLYVLFYLFPFICLKPSVLGLLLITWRHISRTRNLLLHLMPEPIHLGLEDAVQTHPLTFMKSWIFKDYLNLLLLSTTLGSRVLDRHRGFDGYGQKQGSWCQAFSFFHVAQLVSGTFLLDPNSSSASVFFPLLLQLSKHLTPCSLSLALLVS